MTVGMTRPARPRSRVGSDMAPSPEVLVVTSQGCHFCEDALRILDEISDSTPLIIETVPMDSDRGVELMVRHRVPFPPIVLIDRELFGYGRISRRKLMAALSERATTGRVR